MAWARSTAPAVDILPILVPMGTPWLRFTAVQRLMCHPQAHASAVDILASRPPTCLTDARDTVLIAAQYRLAGLIERWAHQVDWAALLTIDRDRQIASEAHFDACPGLDELLDRRPHQAELEQLAAIVPVEALLAVLEDWPASSEVPASLLARRRAYELDIQPAGAGHRRRRV